MYLITNDAFDFSPIYSENMILLNVYFSSYLIMNENKIETSFLIDINSTILIVYFKFSKINSIETCFFLFDLYDSDFTLRDTTFE